VSLLHLAPDIQEALLFRSRPERGRDCLGLRQVLPLTKVWDWQKQRRLWLGSSGQQRERGRDGAQTWRAVGAPVSVILRQKVAAGRHSLLKHWREFVSNSRGARRTLKPPTQGLSGENPGKTGLRRAVN